MAELNEFEEGYLSQSGPHTVEDLDKTEPRSGTGRRSENEQMVECIFEMVYKEIHSNKISFNAVCDNITSQFSDLVAAINTIGDTVTNVKETQEVLADTQNTMGNTIDTLASHMSSLAETVKILKQEVRDLSQSHVDLTQKVECLSKSIEVTDKTESIKIQQPPLNDTGNNKSTTLPDGELSKLRWGSISMIPDTPKLENQKSDIPINETPLFEKPSFGSPLLGSTPADDKSRTEVKTLKTSISTSPDFSSGQIKMKPPPFDGTEDWEEYVSQFEILADLNKWEIHSKGLYLASSLKGSARAVLSDLNQVERRDYDKLRMALARTFGSEFKSEMYRAQLQCRFRKRDESISELATSIMKLTRQAYPKANTGLLDTLSVDYFIDALDDPDVRIRLRQTQPENITHAETLAIRLETCKSADRARHRTVCITTEENSDKTDVKAELVPLFENLMKTVKDEISSIKVVNDSLSQSSDFHQK
ncbi:unnamed protein product [Mytilus edulis]|uniref:Uncharacterized protein n=1 Tax=Mytilus edulis TaxID=6550 RepID=A0A8S3Q4T5_MYTED|nr:unnamed protein product [Mytilus edulis]